MVRKNLIPCLAVFAVLLVGGCVSKSSFEMMENEAKNLDLQLHDLQTKYDQLDQEKDVLLEEKLSLERDKDKLIHDNNSLSEILEAKSDSLSQIIANLRQEKAAQAAELEDRITELDLKVTSFENANISLIAELDTLRAEKEKEMEQVSGTYEELLSKMKSEIDKGQITISELKGKLTVNMVDAILFDSGRADVKKEGLEVLQKVVDILKNVNDKAIRIEGHTDNVQISGTLAARYPTNWELSAARAVNVTRFLQEQGLDPENLGAVAYGEYKPVADNETPEGRAMNRRIEIILVAKE